jgi:uncharacterized membrane protein
MIIINHKGDISNKVVNQVNKGYINQDMKMSKASLQLLRLERLMDVVFALILFRLFRLLPFPEMGLASKISLGGFFWANKLPLILILIGLALVVIYWFQSNNLFGNLTHTDGPHTTLSLLHIFFFLILLYAIRMGTELAPSLGTRLFESVAACLVGYSGAFGWAYAIKGRRLLKPEMSDKEAWHQFRQVLAEPLAATLTIPCAFIGPEVWQVAWLAFIPLAQILKRLRRGNFLKEQK